MTYKRMKDLNPETTVGGYSQKWKNKHWAVMYIDWSLDSYYFLAKIRESGFVLSNSPYSGNTILFTRRRHAESFMKEQGLDQRYYLINLGDFSHWEHHWGTTKSHFNHGKFEGSIRGINALGAWVVRRNESTTS